MAQLLKGLDSQSFSIVIWPTLPCYGCRPLLKTIEPLILIEESGRLMVKKHDHLENEGS